MSMFGIGDKVWYVSATIKSSEKQQFTEKCQIIP